MGNIKKIKSDELLTIVQKRVILRFMIKRREQVCFFNFGFFSFANRSALFCQSM